MHNAHKRIGVISDTHGLLREEALEVLRGVDHIIHAGDIGKPRVVDVLREIAPITIVKGNVDKGEWAQKYLDIEAIEILGHAIYVLHNLDELDIDPAGLFSVVISGHSHIPKSETRGGVLYFNPGSIGPRRFHLPIAMGILSISKERVSGEILQLVTGTGTTKNVRGAK